jgi:CDP-diacylglycerol pyrophosphatase
MNCAVQDDIKCDYRAEWFDNHISQLRVDQLKLDTNMADSKVKKAYNALMSDDFFKSAKFASDTIHQHIAKSIVGDFIYELFVSRKANIVNIAFDLSGHEVLVWAVVKDDDDDAETALYLSESITNAKYEKLNYNMSVTALEESDNIEIPTQYSLLTREKNA